MDSILLESSALYISITIPTRLLFPYLSMYFSDFKAKACLISSLDLPSFYIWSTQLGILSTNVFLKGLGIRLPAAGKFYILTHSPAYEFKGISSTLADSFCMLEDGKRRSLKSDDVWCMWVKYFFLR